MGSVLIDNLTLPIPLNTIQSIHFEDTEAYPIFTNLKNYDLCGVYANGAPFNGYHGGYINGRDQGIVVHCGTLNSCLWDNIFLKFVPQPTGEEITTQISSEPVKFHVTTNADHYEVRTIYPTSLYSFDKAYIDCSAECNVSDILPQFVINNLSEVQFHAPLAAGDMYIPDGVHSYGEGRSYYNMFSNCRNLLGDPSTFTYDDYVSNYDYMFLECRRLTGTAYIPHTTSTTKDVQHPSCSRMYSYCSNLSSIGSYRGIKILGNSDYMFDGCSNMHGTPVFPYGPRAGSMYRNCVGLGYSQTGFKEPSQIVVQTSPLRLESDYIFYGCKGLTGWGFYFNNCTFPIRGFHNMTPAFVALDGDTYTVDSLDYMNNAPCDGTTWFLNSFNTIMYGNRLGLFGTKDIANDYNVEMMPVPRTIGELVPGFDDMYAISEYEIDEEALQTLYTYKYTPNLDRTPLPLNNTIYTTARML